MPSDKYQEILNFWFEESSSKDHWAKNNEYDQKIRARFLDDVEKAIQNAGAIEMAFLEKNMIWLNAVITIAPMLGLQVPLLV